MRAKNWIGLVCLGESFILWVLLEWWSLHCSLIEGLRIDKGGMDTLRGSGSPWVSKEGGPSREPLLPSWQKNWEELLSAFFMVPTSLDILAENLTLTIQTNEICHLQE